MGFLRDAAVRQGFAIWHTNPKRERGRPLQKAPELVVLWNARPRSRFGLVRDAALRQGCRGEPTLSDAACGKATAAMNFRVKPFRRRHNDSKFVAVWKP